MSLAVLTYLFYCPCPEAEGGSHSYLGSLSYPGNWVEQKSSMM